MTGVEHTWQLNARGEPDDYAFDVEAETTGHNGPRCTVCGFYFCVSCFRAGWQHECPGPPPAGYTYDWDGSSTDGQLETPDLVESTG